MPPRQAAAVRDTFHHGDLRAQALQAARQRVAAQGVEKLVLRELAAGLGVNHRALYRHFPDKQALIQQIAAAELDALVARIEAALRDSPDGEPRRTMMQLYVDYALDEPLLYEMVFALPLRDDFDAQTLVGQAVKRLIKVSADVFRMPGDSAAATRDRVVRAWGTAHGLALLVHRGALRAGSRLQTQRYIVEAALAQS